MKLIILAEPKSSHTIKWVRALSEKGISILLFCLFPYTGDDYTGCPNLIIKSFNLNPRQFLKQESGLIKIVFMLALPTLKRIIKEYQPDILHAHYATSYGTLGAWSGFHPFVLSVWGTDVYRFPQKSWIHKKILVYNLSKADKILSTSVSMAKEISIYTNKKIEVTPFGVDIHAFKPGPKSVNDDFLYIGTIKSLEPTYGIEYLISAFKIITDKYPFLPLQLLIVGGGSQEGLLRALTEKLKIKEKTHFTGKIPYDEIVKYFNQLAIGVFPSIDESFGVAVLEASACGKPVIVTNVGGLPEVVKHGITGFIVEPNNSEKIAAGIEKLLLDEKLRVMMGENGRRFVEEKYNLADCVNRMLSIYVDSLINVKNY